MNTTNTLLTTAFVTALLASGASLAQEAARAATGGQPTSTPTHTVPVSPAQRLTIKTKSSPPFAPPIEDRKAKPRSLPTQTTPVPPPPPPPPCGPTDPNDPTTSTC